MKHFKKYEDYSTFLNEAKVNFSKAGFKAKWQEKLDSLNKYVEENPEADWLDDSISKIKDIIKSGKLSWKDHLYIGSVDVDGNYDIFKGSNATLGAKELVKIVNKYKKDEVKQTSVGAAPNSTRFKAAVGGMVDLMINEPVYDGFKGKTLLIGIKVGGGVDRSTKDKIFQEAYETLMPLDQFNSKNGGISIFITEGTNWSCIGLSSTQFGFNSNVENKLKSLI